jgi:hypothetical protein
VLGEPKAPLEKRITWPLIYYIFFELRKESYSFYVIKGHFLCHNVDEAALYDTSGQNLRQGNYNAII